VKSVYDEVLQETSETGKACDISTHKN